MSYTNGLDKPTDYFNTLLWTGDNTSPRSLTGLDFQPDWVWIKRRSSAKDHGLFDSVRGGTKKLESNTTDAEINGDNGQISSFNSDGFSVITGTADNSGVNISGSTFVAWNWLAANGTASNTDGSITSTVSANTTSGFSIVSYTGTGSAATIGHGLGVAPSMIITKYRDDINNWGVYHKNISAGKYLELNTNIAEASNTAVWNNTDPTSSVFSVGTNNRANSAGAMIAYCFAEKKGFSKFGSYTGNGNDDGVFIYTGFTPAFVIRKRTDSTNTWVMFDNKRPEYNVRDKRLGADISDGEASGNTNRLDLLSNGFKNRGTATGSNGSGASYIYMAFAENPFVTSTGIPACAR